MTDEIMAAYRKSLAELGELDDAAQTAYNAITRAAVRAARPLTPEEKEQQKKLRASQVEISDSINNLSFETLQKLDSSSEVEALVARIESINNIVKEEAAKLDSVSAFAKQAQETTAALASLTESAQALKDSLAS